MRWLVAPQVRSEISRLCRDWMDHNRPSYVRLGNLTCGAVATLSVLLTIPFHPTMQDALPNMIGYAIVAMFCFSNAKLARALSARGALTQRVAAALLLAPPVALMTLLSVIITTIPAYGLKVAVYCQILVIIFSSMFINRYWREQYLFNALAIVEMVVVAIIRPEVWDDAALIGVTNILACASTFVFRREFYAALYDRYVNLLAVTPRRVARYLTIAHANSDLEAEFSARERFTACVCSDWRGFQKMAKDLGPAGIAKLFEDFYDVVFRYLEEIDPEGQYFVDWTADEIFVVFYGDDSDEEAVLRRALNFAHALCTSVYVETRAACAIPVIYDVGVSAGRGLLGLLGPKKMKKTTNASFAAGAAKRLETEAKTFRQRMKDDSGAPYVAFDDSTAKVAVEMGIFLAKELTAVTASVKDIAGRDVKIWQDGVMKKQRAV